MIPIARHHAEWLSLVEVSGPFLAMSVLERVFRHGLDEHSSALRQRLAQAHEEWLDNQEGSRPDPAIHRQWVKHVLREVLSYEEQDLVSGQALPPALSVTLAQHHETLRPTWAILEPEDRSRAGQARLLIELVPSGQSLENLVPNKPWKASPAARMVELLQSSGTRLGLVTNGRHFMLVHTAPNETTSYVSFYSHLFFEEPITLRAFQSLLSMRRLFGVSDADTLEALFVESSKDQFEVTDQLGLQVRRAVQILIQTIDRIDRDRQRTLLKGIPEETLYHAAVTVMMRLVFLLAAEERNLLLLGHELYDAHYAISTLRDQLQETADKQGEEVLERRYAAWSRLLATFRAVHGGVTHEDLRLPAYGGSLFDPDRFPFLEGRTAGSAWKDPASATIPPLPIDDRTVLHLLRSVQMLEMKVGTGLYETRRVSFHGLGVEGIGHVYESLLDHTARRAKGPVLFLQGGVEAEVEVLENATASTREKMVEYIVNLTGRAAKAVQKSIEYKIPREDERHWLVACDNVLDVYKRIEPWAGLVRKEADKPAVIPPGSVYVTAGTERRATGTHYTPAGLTGPIVKHTLEPLVYIGPAEGLPEAEWKLRSPREILNLKVCDLAMGSGAFLVQACRYLSERLVKAWAAAEEHAGGKLIWTPDGKWSEGDPAERLLPIDENERKTLARRYVADRCLYGVDKNPMAVEMAKLSLWLETLQKDRPFTFIDHALKSGDSLLGLTSAEQIERFHLHPALGKTMALGGHVAKDALALARKKREELESFAVLGPEDTQRKTHLLREADLATADARLVADVIIGAALSTATKGERALEKRLAELGPFVAEYVGKPTEERRADLRRRAVEMLNEGRGPQHPERTPFHWVIEFPEVFGERGGFDAFVGNPPFQYGTLAVTTLSEVYMRHVLEVLSPSHGKADLIVSFLKRACQISQSRAKVSLIATSGALFGESFDTGIKAISTSGWRIYRAQGPLPWPGSANVDYVSLFSSRAWNGAITYDGECRAILDSLSKESDVEEPAELVGGTEGFMGVKLSPQNRQISITELDQMSPEVRCAFVAAIGGDEINNHIELLRESPMVVDPLIALTLSQVAQGKLFATIGAANLEELEHSRPASALQISLSTNPYAFACGETCVHLAFRLVPKERCILKHKCITFPSSSWSTFSILQSSIHEIWAWRWGLRRQARITYSAKRCAQTFVPPQFNHALEVIGEQLHSWRHHCMVKHGEGLTKTYNRFHTRAEISTDIQTLRNLHVEMDITVAAAYGWTDLKFDHGFHPTKQGERFTLSEAARREVLDRLLELNHQRYQEEVAAGLHDKAKAKKPKETKEDKPAADAEPKDQTTWDVDAHLKSPAPARPSTPAIAPTPVAIPAEAVLPFLRTAYGPVGKNDIVKETGLDEKAFKGAIEALKAEGKVEQVGERRGAKYQVTEKGRKGS